MLMVHPRGQSVVPFGQNAQQDEAGNLLKRAAQPGGVDALVVPGGEERGDIVAEGAMLALKRNWTDIAVAILAQGTPETLALIEAKIGEFAPEIAPQMRAAIAAARATQKKPFPWLIVGAVVVGVGLLGGIIYFATKKG